MPAPKRKPISRTARGVDAYFSDEGEGESQQTDMSVSKHTDNEPQEQLERATFYIRTEQQPTLDELKLNLRKKGLKTDKSALVRAAIDLLVSQDEETVKNLLKEG